ncbi:MAG TPA: tetratricopeptide repeat protein [Gemmatimonadaceae bacterium]|nr:tetratricopeptide repeat protein [Gemmatimonadaceae bacterium]
MTWTTRHATGALLAALVVSAGVANAQARRSSPAPAAGPRSVAIRAELADVLLQSRQYDDAAREYRALLRNDPRNRSYRMNLARALAWGQRFEEAEAELRVLSVQQPGSASIASLLLTVRQAMSPSAEIAATWAAERPGSPDYRRILARALARDGRHEEAVAQYDTLIAQQRTAGLFLERAYINIERRNHAAAESDLNAAIATRPNAEALVLLADLRRWRGDLGSAHALYTRAHQLSPNSAAVAAGFAQLARDERPAAAFLPQVSDGPGWQTASTATTDNLGALLTTVAARRGFEHGPIGGSAGAKLLRLTDRTAVADKALGYGADVALAGEATHRELFARARASVGFVNNPQADAVPDASFTLAAWVRAWGAALEASTGPAYPSLVTLASFLPQDDGSLLTERSATISIAGPIQRLDIAARRQVSAFSDGNARSSLEAFARYPIVPQVSLLYAGSSIAFAQPSTQYWDPARYVSHSIGAEYAVRSTRGLSAALRILPGLAWANERPLSGPDSIVQRRGSLLSAGAEFGYRGESWELTTVFGYSRGRAGDYERYDGRIQARYAP